jgi:hypothetical protein
VVIQNFIDSPFSNSVFNRTGLNFLCIKRPVLLRKVRAVAFPWHHATDTGTPMPDGSRVRRESGRQERRLHTAAGRLKHRECRLKNRPSCMAFFKSLKQWY